MKAEVINCPNPAIEIAAEPAAGKKTDRDVPVNTDKRNDKALRMTENKFEKSNFQSDAQINIFKGKITKNLIEVIAKVIFTISAFVAGEILERRQQSRHHGIYVHKRSSGSWGGRNCTNPVWHGVGAYSGGATFWNIVCHLNLACGYSDGDSYWSSDRTFDSGFPRGGSATEAV